MAVWLLCGPADAAGTPPPVPDELRTLADTVMARLSTELAVSSLGAASFGIEALVIDPRTGGKPPQSLGTIEWQASPPSSRMPAPGRKPAAARIDAVARAFVERIGAAYREPAPPLAN